MNRKYISFVVGIFSFVVLLFVATPHVRAQNTNQKILVVTQFERGQKLNFFFNNSVTPIEFFEVKDAPPVFVSIVTPEQFVMYKKEGYDPLIIDKQAGTLNQYYLLYGKRFKNSNQAALLRDDVQNHRGLELAYQLTNYVSLVKVSPGKKLEQLNIPDLKRAHARQLSNTVAPQNSIISRTKPIRADEKTRPVMQQTKGTFPFRTVFSILIILSVIIVFSKQSKRRRTNEISNL